jgi:GDP-mannose 6-dehydrogenase
VTVIGAADRAPSAVLREVYSWAPGRIFETLFRSVEMVKYVCNAWHDVKVSFANEIGTLAKELGVDAEAVVEIFTADTKLNISTLILSQASPSAARACRRTCAKLSRQGIGPEAATF